MRTLSFIGLGPVGLCTAVCFATRGYKVIASEINEKKAIQIKKGKPPFYEQNLKEMLQKSLKSGNLKIVTNNEEAILESDITFITVGTPSKADGSINLDYVMNASEDIGKALRKKETHQVVVRSTVTPGTTLNVVKPILKKNSSKKCGKDFLLCFNPEFLSEGNAIKGTLNPDYIAIGGAED